MHDNKWFDLNCQLYFEPHKAVSTVPKSLSKISPNVKKTYGSACRYCSMKLLNADRIQSLTVTKFAKNLHDLLNFHIGVTPIRSGSK